MPVVVEMTAKDAQLLESLETQLAKLEEMRDGFKGVSRESLELERSAKRLAREIERPIDRYNRSVAEAKRLVDKGKISQDQYGRAVRRAKERLEEQSQANVKAFDFGLLSRYVAGVYGLNRAYNATLSVLRSINEENREAAQFTRDAEPGLALLGQVTTGGDDFARLQRDARNIFRSGAADSLDQAARTRFQLRSAGLESDDDISLFTSLGSSRLIADLDNLARSAATIFRTLGTEEVGDTSDLISKAFGASDFATATAEEILRAASASGGSARALGLGDEEILAATAILASATGSADKGGTQLASLLRSVDQSGQFEGQSLIDVVRDIEGRGLSGAELQEFLGRAEAVAGFRAIQGNLGTFETAIAGVREAESEGRVFRQIEIVEADPILAASRDARKAAAERQLNEEELGIQEAQAQAAIDRTVTNVREQGASRLGGLAADRAGRLGRFLGDDPDDIAALGGNASRLVDAAVQPIEVTETRVLTDIARQATQTLLTQIRDAIVAGNRRQPAPVPQVEQ